MGGGHTLVAMMEEQVATDGQLKKLSKSVLAVLIIVFSFIGGVTITVGVQALEKRSGLDWMFELAIGLFMLLCAASYARQLVRRAGDS